MSSDAYRPLMDGRSVQPLLGQVDRTGRRHPDTNAHARTPAQLLGIVDVRVVLAYMTNVMAAQRYGAPSVVMSCKTVCSALGASTDYTGRGSPRCGVPAALTKSVHQHPVQLIAQSPIDVGFETHADFDRGSVDIRVGAEQLSEIHTLQEQLTFGQRACSAASVVLTAGTGVGLFYVLSKVTLVRKGEVGLVESFTGQVRVLAPGWHLIETMGTRVLKAQLTDDLIVHGMLKIIRILPGNLGLALSNGHPVFLLPGRHLVVDPLFTFQRQVSMTEPHICISTAHLITVPVGTVGLASVDSTAHFLEAGRHVFAHQRMSFLGFKRATDELINAGSKFRIVVPSGKVRGERKMGVGGDGGAASSVT